MCAYLYRRNKIFKLFFFVLEEICVVEFFLFLHIKSNESPQRHFVPIVLKTLLSFFRTENYLISSLSLSHTLYDGPRKERNVKIFNEISSFFIKQKKLFFFYFLISNFSSVHHRTFLIKKHFLYRFILFITRLALLLLLRIVVVKVES